MVSKYTNLYYFIDSYYLLLVDIKNLHLRSPDSSNKKRLMTSSMNKDLIPNLKLNLTERTATEKFYNKTKSLIPDFQLKKNAAGVDSYKVLGQIKEIQQLVNIINDINN